MTAIATNNDNNQIVINYPNWDKVKFSPKQAAIYNDTSDLVIVKAGRFFGKDHVLLFKAFVKAVWLYFERAGNPEWDRFGPLVQVFIVSPTQNNANDIWDRAQEMLPKIPGIAPNGKPNFHVRHDARQIQLMGDMGIVINFYTTTRADNVRGNGCDILLVTECAYHDKTDLTSVLFNCCIRSGYAGIIYMNSSPFGAGHWFDKEIMDLKLGRGYFHELGFSLHEGNLYDNPKTTEKEIRTLKAGLKTNLYNTRRESLGWLNVPIINTLLADGESLAFNGTQIRNICINNPTPEIGPYRIGIDLAGMGNDHLAVCVLDGEGKIVKLERHAKTDIQDIIRIITRLNNAYRPISISFDTNKGYLAGKNTGALAAVPLKGLTMDNKLKVSLVERFHTHLMAKSIKIPNPEYYYNHISPPKYMVENLFTLLKELYEYRCYNMNKQFQSRGVIRDSQFTTFGKSTDGTDDLVDALLFAASEFPVPYGFASGMAFGNMDPVESAPRQDSILSNNPAPEPKQRISFGGIGNNGNRKTGLFG